MAVKKITKKEFKELCSFQEYGSGMNKRNSIYYGWKPEYGYKYMVKSSVNLNSKKDLFNSLYNWVVKDIPIDWTIQYRYAEDDNERFKVSLMG